MRRLLVEGHPHSHDAPLVRAVARGLAIEVVPSATRGAIEAEVDGDAVRGLVDGDFPASLVYWRPEPAPTRWWARGRRCGWRWRRKELENYWLDGEVLARALGWDDARRADFEGFLAGLVVVAAERTAARVALLGLLDRWDRQVCKPFDPVLAGEALVAALRERHRRAKRPPRFDEEALVERFRAALPALAPGGPAHHPWVIAGKDLFQAAAQAPGVRHRFPELIDARALGARILAALDADPAPWTWVPEWAVLRAELGAWSVGELGEGLADDGGRRPDRRDPQLVDGAGGADVQQPPGGGRDGEPGR